MTFDIRPPEALLSFALAFVGGYGDAVSVILAKTFTGHVTGSLVLGAIAIAAHEWSALVVHLSAVLFFLAGVISSVLIERALEVSGEKTKKAAVTKALQEFIARRKQKRLLELMGKLLKI